MGSTNSVSIEILLILLFMLRVKSVTLESSNDICMQNNTVEYDNWFCF